MVKRKNIKKELSLPLLEELESLDYNMYNEQITWTTPDYITDNMIHRFRHYQENALRYYHYTQTNKVFEYRNINHVLFNMATGSGKTDLMAGLILYLFKEHGYQNFLFLVNAKSVLDKTVENLINKNSKKYLYKPTIEIDGERIEVKQVDMFPKTQYKNTIYLKLSTVQKVASDLYLQKENSMGEEEYAKHKMVVLADEAHHYSASTKSEKENEQSWEKAISTILNVRKDNKLLEFTATVDLTNKNIYEKYKDKIIYRYALDSFIKDGFSKHIKRIQTNNSDVDNMLNAVLLSEYRRRYALEKYGIYIKPVILFKSQRIQASYEAENKFKNLINSLDVEYVIKFIERQKGIISDENSETLSMTYDYYMKKGDELASIIRDIKREFSENRIINANDSDRSNMLEKGHYKALNSLESPKNLYRVIFAVAKLTEGWDVLNLYDIIRLSDDPKVKGTKKSTISEAQLIGRGARYYPFELYGKKSFKRRFEDGTIDSLLLETLHYHTLNEPQYLKNLVESLKEMNLPTAEDTKNPPIDIKVKKSFKKTDVWRKGKIYFNEAIEVDDNYYDSLEKYGVDNKKDVIIPYLQSSKEFVYTDETIKQDRTETHEVVLEFDKRYIKKIMNRLSFYHFNNLKKFIPLLESKEEFLGERWLNINNRTFYVEVPKSMSKEDLTAEEKLRILESYLIDLSKKIKNGYRKKRGTGKFIGYPIKEYVVDYKKRMPKYDTSNLPQHLDLYEYANDFFVYEKVFLNDTESQFVDRIAERISELKEKYQQVYLIRMDENMLRDSVKGEHLKLHQFGTGHKEIHLEGFRPDFILYLENADFMLQIFIEPKGKNIEQEQWKEDLLLYINENEGEIYFEDEVNNVKIKGVKFYTMNDTRETIKQIGEIALKNGFKGLSFQDS